MWARTVITHSTRRRFNPLTNPVKSVFRPLVLLFGRRSWVLKCQHKEKKTWNPCLCVTTVVACNHDIIMYCLWPDKRVSHAHIPLNNQYVSTTYWNLIKSVCTSPPQIRDKRSSVCVSVRIPWQAVFPLWCFRSCPLGAPGCRCETGTWQTKSINSLRYARM